MPQMLFLVLDFIWEVTILKFQILRSFEKKNPHQILVSMFLLLL